MKTSELLKKTTLTETQIRTLLNRTRKGENGQGQRLHDVSFEEVCDSIHDSPPRKITSEQTEKGLRYLRGLRPKVWERCGFREAHKAILETFKEFELVGIDIEYNTYFGNIAAIRPIYRVIGEGASFDYVARPWVSSPGTTQELIR